MNKAILFSIGIFVIFGVINSNAQACTVAPPDLQKEVRDLSGICPTDSLLCGRR